MINKRTMLSRRKFIETSVLSQLALSTGALNLFNYCTANETSSQVLDSAMKKILKAAMDEIIPAGEGMPSASEVGGMNYLLKLWEQFPDQGKIVLSGLTDLNERSNKKFKKDFSEVSSEERTELLNFLEKENATFFNMLRNYTYECYYLNPQVWKLIGYEPHPTLSSGPMMEPFDEKLLERVRSIPNKFENI